MTNKQAFRVGFFMKLAEAGITPSQFMEKTALIDTLRAMFGLGNGAIGMAMPLAGLAAIAPPALLGAGAGYTAAKLNEPSDDEIEAMHSRNLRNHYQTLAEKAKKIKERAAEAEQQSDKRILMRPSAY